MGDLSAHFSAWEFKDHRTGDRVGPSSTFIAKLEALRNRIGRSLPIVSGYRSPATNRAVRGARSSWHLLGRAVDIPLGIVTVAQARDSGFTGIGIRGGWVCHLDDRPGPVTVFHDP